MLFAIVAVVTGDAVAAAEDVVALDAELVDGIDLGSVRDEIVVLHVFEGARELRRCWASGRRPLENAERLHRQRVEQRLRNDVVRERRARIRCRWS